MERHHPKKAHSVEQASKDEEDDRVDEVVHRSDAITCAQTFEDIGSQQETNHHCAKTASSEVKEKNHLFLGESAS